jgi:hypothetical protein
MHRTARVFSSVGAVAFAIGLYLWFFGVQTVLALKARSLGRRTPFLKARLAALSDLSVSRSPGTILSYFGYRFEVPWDDVDEVKTRIVGGDTALIAFRSGNTLALGNGMPHDLVNAALVTYQMDREWFRRLYGDAALQSDYVFQRMMLESTPDQITPIMSKRRATSQTMLLLMKNLFSSQDPISSMFSVHASDLNGFEMVRQGTSPVKFSVELYSDTGLLNFLFIQDGSTAISQSDVNRVLQTLHQ